jgi:mannose-6-phosphate isomerase-like protein (cupin superfamily)
LNIDREFERLAEYWSPRVVATANGQFVKIAKVKGEFVWHSHAEEDEFFLVRKGVFIIRYRDGTDVVLNEGDFHVVSRGVEHMTAAPEECWVIFVEPAATRHTGDIVSERTKSIESQLGELHPWGA